MTGDAAVEQAAKLIQHLHFVHLYAVQTGTQIDTRRASSAMVRELAAAAGLNPAAARGLASMIDIHNEDIRRARGAILAAIEAQTAIVRSILTAAEKKG